MPQQEVANSEPVNDQPESLIEESKKDSVINSNSSPIKKKKKKPKKERPDELEPLRDESSRLS
jgi:hypothetical protein